MTRRCAAHRWVFSFIGGMPRYAMIKRIQRWAIKAVGLVGAAFMLWGGLGVYLQACLWLQYGVWVALPARYLFINLTPADAIAAIPADSQVNPSAVYAAFAELRHAVPSLWTADSDAWIRGHPTSWVGLHKLIVGVLDLVSIPFIAVVIGGTLGVKALGWLAAVVEQEERHAAVMRWTKRAGS